MSSTRNIAALAVHSLGLTNSQALNAADPDCPTVPDIATYIATAMNHEWRIISPVNEVGQDDWREAYPALAAYPADQFDYPAEDRLLR
jgi:hypothetical protein